MRVIDMVKGKRVTFTHYRKGDLWYETECGFSFPVPITDCGDASFLVNDKAPMFMRYIRAEKERIEEGKMDSVN